MHCKRVWFSSHGHRPTKKVTAAPIPQTFMYNVTTISAYLAHALDGCCCCCWQGCSPVFESGDTTTTRIYIYILYPLLYFIEVLVSCELCKKLSRMQQQHTATTQDMMSCLSSWYTRVYAATISRHTRQVGRVPVVAACRFVVCWCFSGRCLLLLLLRCCSQLLLAVS